MPSAMSSTCVSVRVCSPEPKIGNGRSRRSARSIRSGHDVRDARLVARHLARPVGVERPHDRIAQAELVGRRPAAVLARELREPVRRARRGTAVEVVLAWSGTPARARTPCSTTRTRAARPRARSPPGRASCRARCSPPAACREACGSWRCRRRSRPGARSGRSRRAPRRAAARSRRSAVCTSQPRASRPAPGAGRRRAPRMPSRSSRRTTAVPIVPAPPVTRTRLVAQRLPGAVCSAARSATRPARRARTPARRRTRSTGRRPAHPAAALGDRAQRRRLGELLVVGGDHDRGRAARPPPRGPVAAPARAGRGARPRPARARAGGSAWPTASRAGRRSCA